MKDTLCGHPCNFYTFCTVALEVEAVGYSQVVGSTQNNCKGVEVAVYVVLLFSIKLHVIAQE